MIYDDNICTLGEGAHWHPERNQFFWFDILGKRLHTKGKSWGFSGYVSAAGWVDHDTLLIASQTALHKFDIETGTSTLVMPLEAGNPITRSNDGRADPYGGFWIGTMGIKLEAKAGAVYRYYKGELRQLYADLTVPNSISFTPDGGHAYFSNTPEHKVYKVALDNEGWPKGEPEVFLDLSAEALLPDGAVVDADGNFWNAQWGSARVAQYSPAGELIQTVAFGGQQTSCPAFGGEGLHTLFVTTAAEGLEGDAEGKVYYAETTATGQREHKVIL